MAENRIFTLCRMITWIVFLRMFWNFISSLPVKRGGSLSFLVGTISNVLVMEIGWIDVGSGGYILVSCAHSNTSFVLTHSCLNQQSGEWYRLRWTSSFSCTKCTTNHVVLINQREVTLYYSWNENSWLNILFQTVKRLNYWIYIQRNLSKSNLV